MIARAVIPIPPMPFTDLQWAALTPDERRRAATEWYRRAQPLPLQRRWMPRDTARARRQRRIEWVRRMTLLGGWQRGWHLAHLDTADLALRLDQARAEVAQLRAQADSGRTLAKTVTTDFEDACTRVLELSALLLADQQYAAADTAALDLNDRQEAS